MTQLESVIADYIQTAAADLTDAAKMTEATPHILNVVGGNLFKLEHALRMLNQGREDAAKKLLSEVVLVQEVEV